ncbi:potassium channel subfamily T member 2 [Biomphalaria glabrata]
MNVLFYSLDDLLVAGVNKAIHLVISHIQADPGGEENLNDAETIVAVQKISRLFPHVNIITEVNEASNMRFMQFKAKDTYMSQIRKLEKRLKEQALSHLPYMFRLPFAAGKVFSSHMLDRLLYQTFVKGYLISFVRLLLGIDAEKNSGHLSSTQCLLTIVECIPPPDSVLTYNCGMYPSTRLSAYLQLWNVSLHQTQCLLTIVECIPPPDSVLTYNCGMYPSTRLSAYLQLWNVSLHQTQCLLTIVECIPPPDSVLTYYCGMYPSTRLSAYLQLWNVSLHQTQCLLTIVECIPPPDSVLTYNCGMYPSTSE